MGGVPWTAIVGRAVPAERRGRLFATTQVIAGIGRLGVGALVTLILSERYVRFPASGALLVFGCAAFLLISWIFLSVIREPIPETSLSEDTPATVDAALGFVGYLRTLPVHFRARPEIAKLALVQILGTSAAASAPFLLGHSQFHAAGLPPNIAGTFLMVQTAGLLLCAPALGGITDRFGPRQTLLALFGISLFCTVCAVVGGLHAGASVALPLFLIAYFCLGAASDAWTTLTNYLLEAVPNAHEQATFIAIMNAASAPVLVLPLIFGLLVSQNGSATPAYVAASVLLFAGFLVARSLPRTR
jgi:MFS family permease